MQPSVLFGIPGDILSKLLLNRGLVFERRYEIEHHSALESKEQLKLSASGFHGEFRHGLSATVKELKLIRVI
jgi:hypothetical protein